MTSDIKVLAQDNRELLTQVLNLLQDLTKETFTEALTRLHSGSIGGHIRHILEHYVCLRQSQSLAEKSAVNYDARARDLRLETDLAFTHAYTLELSDWLSSLESDSPLNVFCSTNCGQDTKPVSSTLKRELVFLHSHTTHHMAIIRLLMMEFNFVLPSEFGKASSTLKHEQNVQS